MEYRGYFIREAGWGNLRFSYSKADGDREHYAATIKQAKEEIDTIIFEHTIYEVEFCGFTHFFQWLTDAVEFAKRTGGILRNEFDNELVTDLDPI